MLCPKWSSLFLPKTQEVSRCDRSVPDTRSVIEGWSGQPTHRKCGENVGPNWAIRLQQVHSQACGTASEIETSINIFFSATGTSHRDLDVDSDSKSLTDATNDVQKTRDCQLTVPPSWVERPFAHLKHRQ